MSHFTEADLKKIYDANDVDGNGLFNLAETQKAYAQLGAHAKHIDNFEAEFNKRAKDGHISFDDFKHFAVLQ
uniref:EF-hand domain-containing protein n=1 Tax=Plectus sambesii TaxID=2011161 RepID=A0A914WRQ4_9BILA